MKHEHHVYDESLPDVQCLDLYLPEGDVKGAIFWVHGGGWSAGSRHQWRGPATWFAERGYVCSSCDYRLAPAHTWPAALEDVRLAMSWFRQRADRYGFAADRVAAVGSSAGGHLVGMLGTLADDDPTGAPTPLPVSTRPDAVIAYCPVLSMLGADNVPSLTCVQTFMGASEAELQAAYRIASPLHRVRGDEPPFLFLHGDADVTVPLEQSQRMHAALQAHNRPSKLVVLPGVGHGFGYGVDTAPQQEALREVEDFLAQLWS